MKDAFRFLEHLVNNERFTTGGRINIALAIILIIAIIVKEAGQILMGSLERLDWHLQNRNRAKIAKDQRADFDPKAFPRSAADIKLFVVLAGFGLLCTISVTMIKG
jgi:hypothetical protein